VTRVDVRGALTLRHALWQAMGADLSGADALVMAAAVADHRPAETSATKLKKGEERMTLELVRNPDLLAEVGAVRRGPQPVLVGFALETEHGEALVAQARRKLKEKRIDLVVANEASDAFGRDDNVAILVGTEDAQALPGMSKARLADRVLDRLRTLLEEK
jgi:phosphopantothenoylcysteine decarboxylase/phosphopantothenate--cysteine ligase